MTSSPQKVTLKSKLKKIFCVSLVVILIVSSVSFYFWYKEIMKINLQATQVVAKAQKFDTLKKEILTQQEQCKSFIAKGSGDFNQFTYCTRFIKWAESLTF